MKRKKTMIIVFLLIILSLTCNTTQETFVNKRLVTKKDKAKYLQSNSISLNFPAKEFITSNGKADLNLVEIDGLRNKEIENKINLDIDKNIKASIENYFLSSGSKYVQFNTAIALNNNNLISVYSASNKSFDRELNYTEGLLYRLTDGKRLFLKDIFTRGTDYISLLNQKITEKILEGQRDEDSLLMEPFSTIAPKQSFIIDPYYLNIIFHKGQAGFAIDYIIQIPLSEIDSYVDIFDKQENLNRYIYENPTKTIKYNNIFVYEEHELIPTKYRDFISSYPVFSGINNPEIKKNIEDVINESINEVLESDYMKINGFSLLPPNSYLNINISVFFNCHDYICIIRNGYLHSSTAEPLNLFKACTIDLRTGKLVDTKALLRNYADKNERFKEAFIKSILNDIKLYNNDNLKSIENLGTEEAFTLLLNNSTVFFRCYTLSDSPCIVLNFDESTKSPFPLNADADFYTELNTQPELFFK